MTDDHTPITWKAGVVKVYRQPNGETRIGDPEPDVMTAAELALLSGPLREAVCGALLEALAAERTHLVKTGFEKHGS